MNDIPWYVKVQNQLRNIAEQNIFTVKDLIFVNAEVKLLKCVITSQAEDLPIDMSANQTGGLSTLCFLTEVYFSWKLLTRCQGRYDDWKKSFI
jgi:hypothetical protein